MFTNALQIIILIFITSFAWGQVEDNWNNYYPEGAIQNSSLPRPTGPQTKVISISNTGVRTERDPLASRPLRRRPTPLTHQRIIRILSYNIHSLPEIITPDNGRAALIGKILGQQMKEGTAPDVVALQEAFTDHVKEIVKYAGYKYVHYGPKSSFGKMNSGLAILSQHPIIEWETYKFNNCYSLDCFSNKGAQFIRIKISGIPTHLDIYNTHLNSNLDGDFWSTDEVPKDVRWMQAHDLLHFIDRHTKSNAPVIFVGDFNMRPHEMAFSSITDAGYFKESSIQCAENKICKIINGDPSKEYKSSTDHHFYRSGTSPIYRITPTQFTMNFNERPTGIALSDHLGLQIDYKIEW